MKIIYTSDTAPICGIYLIEYPNGKKYVGQAENIHSRILEHNSRARVGSHNGKDIQTCDKAIKKYFPNGIKSIILLEECCIEELDQKEKFWINYYQANKKEYGYNYLDHGDVSGRRGVDNVNASVTQEKLEEIIDLLQNHYELSCVDIANKCNVSVGVIYNINLGKTYVNTELHYPLRNGNIRTFQKKDNLFDYFENEEKLLEFKRSLKYDWELNMETEIPDIWGIPRKICKAINQGLLFSEYGNYSYPIRPKNKKNNFHFLKQDIINILQELRNTKYSMTEIGNHFNIGRAAVASINQGKTYIIEAYDYPARKTKN